MRRTVLPAGLMIAVIAAAITACRPSGEASEAAGAAPATAEAVPGDAGAGTAPAVAGDAGASPAPAESASPAPEPEETGAAAAAGGARSVGQTAGAGAAEAVPGRTGSAGAEQPPAVAEASATRDEAQADAAAILRRAAAAYADVSTISAEFTQRLQNRLLRTDAQSSGHLYQRHPDRFLMRFEDPAGDVIVSDGRYFWLYYPSVDSLQVMRAPAAAQGSSGVDLRSQFVGDPLERFEATLAGREPVGGRAAHVLVLVPKQPQGYERLRIWVDDRDHLVRRFEITEENGNVRLIELRDLQINRTLDDALFRFTPPPGARIVDRG